MRFLGEDPVAPSLEQPLSLNPFVYGLNNPLRWVDPDGLLPVEETIMNSKSSSSYGQRKDPITGAPVSFHRGADFISAAKD